MVLYGRVVPSYSYLILSHNFTQMLSENIAPGDPARIPPLPEQNSRALRNSCRDIDRRSPIAQYQCGVNRREVFLGSSWPLQPTLADRLHVQYDALSMDQYLYSRTTLYRTRHWNILRAGTPDLRDDMGADCAALVNMILPLSPRIDPTPCSLIAAAH